MTFEEYLKLLVALSKEHPEALQLPVISAADDEGNRFNAVRFKPQVGKWTEGNRFDNSEEAAKAPDAVCIN